MMPMYTSHPWSKQRREAALREAQRRSLAKQAEIAEEHASNLVVSVPS